MENDSTSGDDKSAPLIRPISAPMYVPVFNIVIYISTTAGKVLARVANLPDIEFAASSEPLALKKTITHVKQQLYKWHTQSAITARTKASTKTKD